MTMTPETTAAAYLVGLIPLEKLHIAKQNVRRTDRANGIAELAESIAAEGLLQNLTAVQTRTGCYRVIAGGRRLAALKLLAKAGRWRGPVPCRVMPSAVAARVSLTENVMRAALHPADEVEAFRTLIDEGHGIAEVARRFGTTARHVEQRLKLAAVSPVLMRAYRSGDMTLDQLTAFAAVDDHAQQEQVWADLPQASPRGIRAALLGRHLPATDKLARFVGIETYAAAGGAVIRDLFSSDEDGIWLADADLLRRLAAEKLQAIAADLQDEGWGWVETLESFLYAGFSGFDRVYPRQVALAEAARTTLMQLTERRDALLTALKSAPSDDTLIDELHSVETAIAGIRERERTFDRADMARAGCAIGLTAEGVVKIERGLLRPEDVRQQRKAAARAEALARAATDGVPALPGTLLEELTAQRTAALRVTLMRRPDLALAAVVHSLALPAFYPQAWQTRSALDLTARSIGLAERMQDPRSCPALAVLENEKETWRRRLPGDAGDLWQWCIEQDRSTLLQLIAVLAADSVNAVKQRHDRAECGRLQHADALAKAARLDMTAWWSADEAFLSRLSKAQIAAMVQEATGSAKIAAALPKLPKGEAIKRGAQALAGRGWLPEPLRTPAGNEGDAAMTMDAPWGEQPAEAADQADARSYAAAAE